MPGQSPWWAAWWYGVGLGTYEFGAGLPILYFLMWPGRWVSRLRTLWPFGLVLSLYAIWRLSHGFGLAQGLLYTPRSFEVSLWTVKFNLMETISWWLGPNLWLTCRNGISTWLAQPLPSLVFLGLANILASVLVWRSLPSQSSSRVKLDRFRLVGIGLVWAAITAAPSLISWTGGRLNYLPAAGVALALATLLLAHSQFTSRVIISLLILVTLTINQGTARQWQLSGQFNRNLVQSNLLHTFGVAGSGRPADRHPAATHWPTAGSRVTGQQDPRTWAYYLNAGLLRGFAPMAMAELAGGQAGRPHILLDVEHIRLAKSTDWIGPPATGTRIGNRLPVTKPLSCPWGRGPTALPSSGANSLHPTRPLMETLG